MKILIFHNSFTILQDIFSTVGIKCIFKKLEPSKSAGSDGIPTSALKLCAREISPILQIIYTQSLSEGTLPND